MGKESQKSAPFPFHFMPVPKVFIFSNLLASPQFIKVSFPINVFKRRMYFTGIVTTNSFSLLAVIPCNAIWKIYVNLQHIRDCRAQVFNLPKFFYFMI